MKSIFSDLERRRNLFILFIAFLWINYLLSSFLPKEHALDLKFAYSVEEAYQSLSHLSLDEINLYSFGIWSLDMPYLLIYFLFFSALLKRLWGGNRYFIIPLAIAGFDLFENMLLLRILGFFPERYEVLVSICSIFSTAKWLSVGILIICLGAGAWNYLVSRKKVCSISLESEFDESKNSII